MEPGKRYAHLHVGNLLQLAGAALGCYGMARYSIAAALIVGGIVVVLLANLEYDGSVLHIPVPARRRPGWQRGTRRARLLATWKGAAGFLSGLSTRVRRRAAQP